MTTLPPRYDSHTFEMEQVTVSSTASPPPAKPQRSFRNKREEQETTAYLEGCDYMEEEEARGCLEEKSKGCDGEADQEREVSGFYLLGEGGGSPTETDEEGEEEHGGESREEKKERKQEEEVEETAEQEDGEERRVSEEEEVGSNKEKDEMREEEKVGNDREKKRREEDGEIDDETGSRKKQVKNGTTEGGEPASSPPRPGRRSRVIRLYQYDEDGQRYCHLPDPAPDEPGPAPRLKQRSVSLTRLNVIMATASAGPLDTSEMRREEREERPHFHMEI